MQNARLAAGGTLSGGLQRWAFSVNVRHYYTCLRGFVQDLFEQEFEWNRGKEIGLLFKASCAIVNIPI